MVQAVGLLTREGEHCKAAVGKLLHLERGHLGRIAAEAERVETCGGEGGRGPRCRKARRAMGVCIAGVGCCYRVWHGIFHFQHPRAPHGRAGAY